MTHTVVIVDDDPGVRATLALALRADAGLHVVGAAGDVESGRRLIDATCPDVALIDLDLPDGSGIELIRHVALHHPRSQTAVVTVLAGDGAVLDCIRAGAAGYLLKDAIDVARQVREICQGGSPISPSIARRLLHLIKQPPAAGPAPQESPGAVRAVRLSGRELSVLELCAKGYNFSEIAGLIRVNGHTVATYVKRIYRKLQVHSKTEAVYEARKLGLIDD